jgi:hypothetical protein
MQRKEGAFSVYLKDEVLEIAGYPPCPYIADFKKVIETKYQIPVVIGTHPIPQKYYLTHKELKTWDSDKWQELIKPTLATEPIRLSYD